MTEEERERLKSQTDELFRADWRELGFYYDVDRAKREWRLTGSRAGLERFAAIVEAYAANLRNDSEGEHKHIGPYMYLEIGTMPEPGIDGHWIFGSLMDLRRLAKLMRDRLRAAAPGEVVRIQDDYADGAEFGLALDVRADDFDPGSLDPMTEWK